MEEVNESFCRGSDWADSQNTTSTVSWISSWSAASSFLWSFCTVFTLTSLKKKRKKQQRKNTMYYNAFKSSRALCTCEQKVQQTEVGPWMKTFPTVSLTRYAKKKQLFTLLTAVSSADTKPGKAAARFWADETPHWPNRPAETLAENRWKIKGSNKYCRRLGNHALIISHYAAITAPFISKRAHLKGENAHELIKIIH